MMPKPVIGQFSNRCKSALSCISRRCPENRRSSRPPRLFCTFDPSARIQRIPTPHPSLEGIVAVIFDVDGVLAHSGPASRSAACKAFQMLHGISVHPNDFDEFSGMGEHSFIGGVAFKYGLIAAQPGLRPLSQADEGLVSSLIDSFLTIYKEYCQGEGSCQIGDPGALQLLTACKAAGYRTAVASSAKLRKVEANLLSAQLSPFSDFFDAVISGDKIYGPGRLKPAPDIFLEAASALGLSPDSCLVIEDSLAGVQAAQAAGLSRELNHPPTIKNSGMRVVGLNVDQGKAQQLLHAGALEVYPTLSNLQKHLFSSSYEPQAKSKMDKVPLDTEERGGRGLNSSQQQGTESNWLEGTVLLPAGYRTTRRELLKFFPLAGGIGSLWVAVTHLKAMSFGSPQALINSLLPQAPKITESDLESRINAYKRYISDLEERGGGKEVPDFSSGLDWFNVSTPLSLRRQLKGKIVVLDFWTYCCINCIHILPELAAFESQFCGELGSNSAVAVVGVHSAKFDNEKDSDAIRNAVLRNNITHSVVNDAAMQLWNSLGVSSWPTLAVVSPKGRLIAMLAGEGHREDLSAITEAGLRYYGEKGLLDSTPLPQALERDRGSGMIRSQLKYPGKIASDLEGDRLFISDSNNHRIVVTTLDGKYLQQIGGNGSGLRDGSFKTAVFNRCQGIAFDSSKNLLYVCDTENHALRCCDLTSKVVTTLAGDGFKGEDFRGGSIGKLQRLNSPWDLVLIKDQIFLANAGSHQIWCHDIFSGKTENFSGTGYERNQNGPTWNTTSWSQPSGLSLVRLPGDSSSGSLVVADSESSSIRLLDLENGSSKAVVGGDPLFSENLFRFGNQDGIGFDALLQHPLAVVVLPDNRVVVADSYNHTLRVLNLDTKELTTLVGNGLPGFKDGAGQIAQFSEPSGLALGPSGQVFVCDTNNNVIRLLDIESKIVKTVSLRDIPPPAKSPLEAIGANVGVPPLPAGAKLVKGQLFVRQQPQSGSICISISLPQGYHLTKGAGSGYTVSIFNSRALGSAADSLSPISEISIGPMSGSSAGTLLDARNLTVSPTSGLFSDSNLLTSTIKYTLNDTVSDVRGAFIRLTCKVYYCQDNGPCLFEQICFDIEMIPGEQPTDNSMKLSYELVPIS